MRYYSEPWRNRVLGDGWSHNPYKRLVGMDDDPDIRATLIAEKYIGLMTEYLRERGWLPLVGVEVNFTPYGIDPQALTDVMDEATQQARKRWRPRSGTRSNELLDALKDLQAEAVARPNSTDAYDLDFPHLTVRRKDPQPDDAGEVPFYLAAQLKSVEDGMDNKLAQEFIKRAQRVQAGQANSLFDLNQTMLLMRMIAASAERGGILAINPAMWNGVKHYLDATLRERAYDPQAGMISRTYLDGTTEHAEDPEITTPPRAPLTAVRHVNHIKQMLMESTYRFKNDARTSRTATALREKVGDIDVSFIDPEGYYNLAEHLNFSVLACDDDLRDYKDLKRHPNPDKNNVVSSTQALLMKTVFQFWLASDRLLSIGNRFPYDETRQLTIADKDWLHARIDREDRIKGRVELTNFHDASSNVALSTLAVMSATCALRQQMDAAGHGPEVNGTDQFIDLIDRMRTAYPPSHLPRTPGQGVQAFSKNSISVQAMRMVGEAMLGKDALPEIEKDIDDFKAAAIKRHDLLIKRPWGGKERAAQERAKGWRVAHAERVQQEASDRGPDL